MTRLFDGVPFPAGRKEWGRKYHWKSQKYSFRIGGLNPVRRAGFWNWAGSQEVPCQIFTFQIICDTLNLLFKYKLCARYSIQDPIGNYTESQQGHRYIMSAGDRNKYT